MFQTVLQTKPINAAGERLADALVGLGLAAALLHPNAFGLMWIMLILVCLWRAVTHRVSGLTISPGPVWRFWLIAFGPLLLMYALSVMAHGSTIGRIEALEPVLGGLILAAGFSGRKANDQWLVRGALLGGALGLGLVIVEMGVFGEPRVGTQFHPINFGMACGATLLILVMRLREGFHTPTAAGAVACGLALMASGSRGPIFAFLICFAILVFLRNRQYQFPRKGQSTLGYLLAGLTAIAIAVLTQRFLTDAALGNHSSVGIRWELIKISFIQMLHTPWFGIGADRAGVFFAQFPGPVSEAGHAHVTALNLGLELGVVGMLSWIWGFGALGWFFWKVRPETNGKMWILGLLMTAYLFLCSMAQDLMSHTFDRRFIAFIIVTLMVAALSEREGCHQDAYHKMPTHTTQ